MRGIRFVAMALAAGLYVTALAGAQPLFTKGEFLTGCNYWASDSGIYMWRRWNPATVEKDVAELAQNGVGVMQVFPLWPDFQPLAHACATDPADARRIVICTYDAPYHDFAGANGVSVSSDDGTTWKQADEGLPIRRATCVAFDPFDSETIVVGTGGGGFFRTRWPR